MKFTILNGSPKGKESVTMQYLHYINKKHPEHEYNIIDVAQQIKKIEKDEERFNNIMLQIKESLP